MNWIDTIESSCSWINIYYGVLSSYINEKNYKSIIEIGLAYGGHAEEILTNTNIDKYIGIDPYLSSYDDEDCFDNDVHLLFNKNTKQESMDELSNKVNIRLSSFNNRFTHIRKTSTEAALENIEDNSVDIVFIDGNHTYEAVKSDIDSYWKKIKENGTLCGDDYDGFEGVRIAVHEFAIKNNLSLNRMVNVKTGYLTHWFVIKDKL